MRQVERAARQAEGAVEGQPTGDAYADAMEEMEQEADPFVPEAAVQPGDAIDADGELIVRGSGCDCNTPGDERNVPHP